VLSGIETVLGSAQGDVLTGGAANETLQGDGGDDTLIGGAGSDSLIGGSGFDTADYSGAAGLVAGRRSMAPPVRQGEAAGDTLTAIERLVGSVFDDTLGGSAGADTILGGAGTDAITGGAGNRYAERRLGR